jgi:glycine/D-amino acid oxidase-like deaminating enzyme
MYDLAIVGGGILGCLVVDEAARARPDWRVVLLEASAIASGATRWSLGVNFPLAATPGHRKLVRCSGPRWERLARTSAGYAIRLIPMRYVLRRSGLEAFARQVVDRTLRLVTTAEYAAARDMLPDATIRADEVMVTHDEPGFAVALPAFAEALVTTCCTELVTGQRISSVERTGNGYRLCADGRQWRAQRVVVAVGPWELPRLVPTPSLPPERTRIKQVAALRVRLPMTPESPLVYFLDDDLFFLPMPHGEVLVSFYCHKWDINPNTCDGSLADELAMGREVLATRSHIAADAVTGCQAFCDRYAAMRLPFVWTPGHLPGFVATLAGSGSGVRLGPGLARLAIDSLLTPCC